MTTETKDSGVKWIGTVPSDWEINKIKYIAVLKGRIGWQGLTSDEYTDEGAYLITGVDFENGGINWDSCVHVPMRRWEEARDIQIEDGDLLITKDGTIGKVAIVSGCTAPTSLNSGVLRISTIDGYDRRFLYWVLQSDVFWTWFADKNAGNSTIQHLYQGDFAEFKYAIPPIDEQRAIATFLDAECAKIDSIINDLERQIILLQKYRKSVITKAVTKGIDDSVKLKESGISWMGCIPANWNLTRLKYVAELLNGDRSDNYPNADDLVDEGIVFIASNNIHDLTVNTTSSNCKYISEEKYNLLRGAKLRINDIVYCLRGSVGMCAINKSEAEGAIASSLVVIRSKDINADYLNYYLQSCYNDFLTDLYTNGSCAANLSAEDVSTYHVTIPPIDEQNEIVKFLDIKCRQINAVVSDKQVQLNKILNHKQSLIYEYVTGKKTSKGGHKPCRLEQTN